MVFATSFLPGSANPAENEVNIVREENIPLITQKTVRYPLDNFTFSQGYSLFHPAIDLAAPVGTEVKPIKNGVVEAVSQSKYGYGNAVIINHGGEVTSLYGHLSKINVAEGEKVTTNSVIGEVGRTGHATGPHLHLEVRRNGIPINPFAVLPFPASSRG